jgi:hypothetical protein
MVADVFWPSLIGTLLGALVGGGATVLAVVLTTRAQSDREVEARHQDRMEGAYADLARYIGRQASVIAWVQMKGLPSKENPLPMDLEGAEATLSVSTGAGLFASEEVRSLLVRWIAAHGAVTKAQIARKTDEAADLLEQLLGLNDELMQAMIKDLARSRRDRGQDPRRPTNTGPP